MCEVSLEAQWVSVRLFDGDYLLYRPSGVKGREGAGTYTQKGDNKKPGTGRGEGGEDSNSSNKAATTTGNSSSSSNSSPQKPVWAAMEGPVYICDYLGYKTLNKPATNVAGLQPAVKELYLQFRKSLQQGGPPPKKSSFKITPGGLLVSLHESGGPPLEMFFDITCINLIQAVRFALLKGSEKKPKAVFVPIDDGSRAHFNVEKSVFSLDKAFHFLVHTSHQPLLVCVLRRPKGVKALDCHVFGMDSPENVLYVQSCVQQLLTSGGSTPGEREAAFNRSGTRGDFVRTEFGDYNVYRGGAGGQGGPQGQQKFELKDEFFRGGGDGGGGGYPSQLDPGPGAGPRGGGQPSPRETYPAESSERPRFGWSYDKPQSGEDFRRISGGQYGGGGDGRPVSAELRPPGNAAADGRPGNQFYPDARQFPGDRRSGELAGGGGGSGYNQGYRRTEYERAEVSHVRERSGDSGDNRFAGGSRKVSGNSEQSAAVGGVVRGGGEPQDARYGPPLSPRSEAAPPRVMQKPVSPVRGPAFRPTSPTPGGQGPLSPRVSAESPRTPTSPYSPTGGPPVSSSGSFKEGPAFSLSNRENRADEVGEQDPPSSHGKPVAKVPPHLKGVKVLPSDFLAVKLKPKQQRVDSEESDHGYDNHKNILAQYKQLQLQEQDSQEGFSAFDEPLPLDKPGMSRSYSSNWNDSVGGGQRLPPELTSSAYEYRRYGGGGGGGEEERRYIEQYSEQDTVLLRSHAGYRDGGEGGSSGGGGGDWRSKSAYDMAPGQGGGYPHPHHPARGEGAGGGVSAPSSAANDEKQMGRKKDAEIASMFTGGHYSGGLRGREEAFNPDRNNFEQSLGYLP